MRPEITSLLGAVANGDTSARNVLFEHVYDELKKIAKARLRGSDRVVTLNPTSLLHEAWIRFAHADVSHIESSVHFYNTMAQAMRQLVLDHAKRKRAEKHGGMLARVDLTNTIEQPENSIDDLLTLTAAIDHLKACDEDLAQLVEWHAFAGLSLVDIARIRGVTHRTAKRHWAIARAFLGSTMTGSNTAISSDE